VQRLRLLLSALAVGLPLAFASAGASADTGADAAADTTAIPDPAALPAEWSIATLPGAHVGVTLIVLKRAALAAPARYRVVVLPGSGCTGWRPVAARYFAGLLHAELLVLHKPGVDINASLKAQCSPNFVAQDTLSSWRDHATAALRAYFSPFKTPSLKTPELPVLLVGISEGAELLPALADTVPTLAGVVMVSAPGIDPRDAGELQALQWGRSLDWQALQALQASSERDDRLAAGRTLGYWRDFWRWPLATPLLDAPWPLLRVWGDADALVPMAAYQRFAQQAQSRRALFCDLRLPGADHGLQGAPPDQRDGLQWLWAQLEAWARHPAPGLCAQLPPFEAALAGAKECNEAGTWFSPPFAALLGVLEFLIAF